MKRSSISIATAPTSASDRPNPSVEEINAKYGLEPVYEAGSDPRMQPLGHFVSVRCPHCFERFDTDVETIYGGFTRIEDCQICCRPIELRVDIEKGEVVRMRVERAG